MQRACRTYKCNTKCNVHATHTTSVTPIYITAAIIKVRTPFEIIKLHGVTEHLYDKKRTQYVKLTQTQPISHCHMETKAGNQIKIMIVNFN